jgi:hypothetical protein
VTSAFSALENEPRATLVSIWNKVRPPVPPTPVIVTAVAPALNAAAPVEELEIVVMKPF